MAAKAAVAVLSDERLRKAVGWTVAAVLSPVILVVVVLCSLLSGTANHNVSAVQLSFSGAPIGGNAPQEYRAYIDDMRASFVLLDGSISSVESQMEGDDSLDSTRVKAAFYALYFGDEQPSRRDTARFVDCFVTWEERTRTVENEDGSTSEETYTLAVPIEDNETVWSRIGETLGIEVTAENKANADNIYSLIEYGYIGPGMGGDGWAGAEAPFIGADGFCSPVGEGWQSIVTSEFGNRRDPITGERRGHTGMDLADPMRTPIRAALPGTVIVSAYNQGGYGYYVMIDHGNGLTTLYGHCSQLIVSVGHTVQAGDVISLSGSTGRSTGPHLHFEVRVNGQRADPRPYLP